MVIECIFSLSLLKKPSFANWPGKYGAKVVTVIGRGVAVEREIAPVAGLLKIVRPLEFTFA
jgi:hypothetical protein